ARYAGGGSATVATVTAADSRWARRVATRAAPKLPSVPSRASKIFTSMCSSRINLAPRRRGKLRGIGLGRHALGAAQRRGKAGGLGSRAGAAPVRLGLGSTETPSLRPRPDRDTVLPAMAYHRSTERDA